MTVNLFSFDELEDDDFQLFAIRTPLDDYRLAYFLNQSIKSFFVKVVPDLDYVIKGEKAFFPSFKYKNAITKTHWYLVKNKFKVACVENKPIHIGLFEIDETLSSTYVYLQPEIKEADFFLKVEEVLNDDDRITLLKYLNNIKGIVTAYEVDIDKLKHKEYLIF